MNIKGYEYLDAISRAASISGAAKKLGISQPSLSSFLQETEKELGVTLFDRSGRTLSPTEAGLIYLDACSRILQVKHQTYNSINSSDSHYSETITVGVTAYRGSRVFSDLYPSFCQRYQDVRIELKEGYMGTLMDDITGGRIALGLGTIPATEEDRYSYASQAREELLLCVPLFHPLSGKGAESGTYCPTADIRDFADTPFVMWGSMTTNSRLVSSLFMKSGISPTIIYESNNALLIDTMLQKNMGAGFLPASFCKSGQNRVYFSVDPPLFSITCVLFSPEHVLTEAERYFIYLVSKFHFLGYANTFRHYNDVMLGIYNEFEGL